MKYFYLKKNSRLTKIEVLQLNLILLFIVVRAVKQFFMLSNNRLKCISTYFKLDLFRLSVRKI